MLYPLLARMLVTLLHLPWWLHHLLQTEIVTSFVLLPCDWVLLGFEGLSFLLLFHSLLMSSLSPSLMVVVASLKTPILCLASVIELFRKMIIVLRFRSLSPVWVCFNRRGVVSRSCHSCQSLAVDLRDLIECWCTKLCSANVSLVWTLSSL